jgi:hypothetical protein
MKAAVQALKTAEQQQQAGLALHPTGGSASQRFTGSHFLASRTSSMRDVEQGRPGAAGGGQAGVGGPLAVAGKLRAVWSAVGKVAGFLPPAPEPGASEGALAGPFGSSVVLQEGGVLAGVHQHSSTSWGASSGSEAQGARPPGAGRPPSPPARQLRAAAATAAPQSPVALREAYPQL